MSDPVDLQRTLKLGPVIIHLIVHLPHTELRRLDPVIEAHGVENEAADVLLEVHARHPAFLHPELRTVPAVLEDRLLWPALELTRNEQGWHGEGIATADPVLLALRWVLGVEILARGGLLLHASSVLSNGAAHVFMGTSGAGKTTIAREGDWDAVFSDELTILAPDGSGSWMVWPSPFWGNSPRSKPDDHDMVVGLPTKPPAASTHKAQNPAPLEGLWCLRQSDHTEISPLTPSEAAVQVYQRTFEIQAAERAPVKVLEIVSRIIAAVPVRTLSWKRGERPGPIVGRASVHLGQ